LFHKKFGNYPEDLDTVMAKVKSEKTYSYDNMLVMLLAALFPLLLGASIGPEAGLTGVIIGLCYWAGDNLKFAGVNTKAYSEVGTAVTLSVLFGSPLFGIFAVEEDDGDQVYQLTKSSKIFLYGLAIAGGMGAYMGLTAVFGAGMEGIPTFETALPRGWDFPMMIVYILAGCILAWFYEKTHHGFHHVASKMPAVAGETAAGLCLGVAGAFVPMVMFSGEGEMHELMHSFGAYLPWMLVGLAFLKVLLTNICIQLGLKGGHFFPLIFAGVCLGYGIAMFAFPAAAAEHVVFGAAIVTSALLGGTMRKPMAVTMLLFLCFPVRMFVWIFLAAVVSSKVFGKIEEKEA
jgi:H+/Cl- antiporter ClcA